MVPTVSSAVGSPFLTLGHLQHKQLNRKLSGIANVPHQKMKSAAPNEVGVSVLTPPEYTTTVTASAGACSRHSATLCSQCYVVCWCGLAAAVGVGYLPRLWGSDAQRCSYWSLWTCRTRHSQCERNIRCRQAHCQWVIDARSNQSDMSGMRTHRRSYGYVDLVQPIRGGHIAI